MKKLLMAKTNILNVQAAIIQSGWVGEYIDQQAMTTSQDKRLSSLNIVQKE